VLLIKHCTSAVRLSPRPCVFVFGAVLDKGGIEVEQLEVCIYLHVGWNYGSNHISRDAVFARERGTRRGLLNDEMKRDTEKPLQWGGK
jgi:hypothetical protein